MVLYALPGCFAIRYGDQPSLNRNHTSHGNGLSVLWRFLHELSSYTGFFERICHLFPCPRSSILRFDSSSGYQELISQIPFAFPSVPHRTDREPFYHFPKFYSHKNPDSGRASSSLRRQNRTVNPVALSFFRSHIIDKPTRRETMYSLLWISRSIRLSNG